MRKLELFRSIFAFRQDLVAQRWSSQNGDRSGYSPVCANEWRKGVCLKVQAGRCRESQRFEAVPLSDELLLKHLRGERSSWVDTYSSMAMYVLSRQILMGMMEKTLSTKSRSMRTPAIRRRSLAMSSGRDQARGFTSIRSSLGWFLPSRPGWSRLLCSRKPSSLARMPTFRPLTVCSQIRMV